MQTELQGWSDESISFHLPTNTHKNPQLQSDSILHWISHTCLDQHNERGQDRQWNQEIEYRYIHCFLCWWIKAFSSAQLQLHSVRKVSGSMLSVLLPATSPTWNLIPSLLQQDLFHSRNFNLFARSRISNSSHYSIKNNPSCLKGELSLQKKSHLVVCSSTQSQIRWFWIWNFQLWSEDQLTKITFYHSKLFFNLNSTCYSSRLTPTWQALMFVLKSDYRLLMTRIWFLPLLLLSPTVFCKIPLIKRRKWDVEFYVPLLYGISIYQINKKIILA